MANLKCHLRKNNHLRRFILNLGGQLAANAVFFRLRVLADNLCRGFQRWALQKEWRRHHVQTLRWRLYQIAGKVVRHAGRDYLKVREPVVELFESIRAQCW